MSEEEQPNPYNARDHEITSPMGKNDLVAVASLFGHVAGSLGEIDKQNVGGGNQFIRAKRLDPRSAINSLASKSGVQSQPVQQPKPPSVMNTNPPELIPQIKLTSPEVKPKVSVDESLVRRIEHLEKIVESYKKITKFKRGISYNISTSAVTGEYKDPAAILDLVASSLANQAKTITLKLNDKTKDRK